MHDGGQGWQRSILPAMFNKAYMLKTAVNDLLLPDSRFPKEGQVTMTGGRVFADDDDGRAAFERELQGVTWFSYRQGFGNLVDEDSSQPITYDTGWGCVHRTGQMLLMATLRKHLAVQPQHLLHHFKDSRDSSFSIQRIAMRGTRYGKPPGQWFNSSTVAHVLKDLVEHQTHFGRFLHDNPLHVEVVKDQQIQCPRVLDAGRRGGVLVLIPFMLGIESPNKLNEGFLLSCIRSKWSMGVLGGRPRHALYFIGYKADALVCLDPHRVQPAYTDERTKGVLSEPRRRAIACGDIDTCCLLTFFAKDYDASKDLLTWLRDARYEGKSARIFDVQGYSAVDSTAVDATPVPMRASPSPSWGGMSNTPPDSPEPPAVAVTAPAPPAGVHDGGGPARRDPSLQELRVTSLASSADALGGSWSVVDAEAREPAPKAGSSACRPPTA
eukprot:TRINITY_DN787_c0_g1_i2.p1 TRINITY_DN787_c0_g1~~TRINITY_DN787_c0_g1_i2.p1  ORF type:complete len:498 (+),score=164.07 TRINITY_DN787_c0_g1_i2:179-1495(+)